MRAKFFLSKFDYFNKNKINNNHKINPDLKYSNNNNKFNDSFEKAFNKTNYNNITIKNVFNNNSLVNKRGNTNYIEIGNNNINYLNYVKTKSTENYLRNNKRNNSNKINNNNKNNNYSNINLNLNSNNLTKILLIKDNLIVKLKNKINDLKKNFMKKKNNYILILKKIIYIVIT